jgi:hypothetical protein
MADFTIIDLMVALRDYPKIQTALENGDPGLEEMIEAVPALREIWAACKGEFRPDLPAEDVSGSPRSSAPDVLMAARAEGGIPNGPNELKPPEPDEPAEE